MKKLIILLIILSVSYGLMAVSVESDDQVLDMYHLMTNLLFQLAVIIFIARGFGFIIEKIGFPSVLGELAAGILIGPYLLGSLPIWGFPQGVFPEHVGSNLPISPELYGFSIFGLVILLFLAGLETDTRLLRHYSLAGFFIALVGLVLSFAVGAAISIYFLGNHFFHPVTLFYGLISSVTSVGITARILSEQRSMDSPEGVTIHLTTVINDVLVIIALALVMAISSEANAENQINISWDKIFLISIKSFGILALSLLLGLLFSQKLSSALKLFKNKYLITFIAFALALLVSSIFEKVGLAMIIGAYITGLALSRTDISFNIQETLHPIERFFVPIFFAVMGMKINVITLMDREFLLVGIGFTLLAIFAKVFGCGLTSLFFNFNKLGALRIGFGMAPRGEVALIIAGIGLSSGFLQSSAFGIVILMIILTTLISPQILNSFLKKSESGVRKQYKIRGITQFQYLLTGVEEVEFLVSYITRFFHNEGFYINRREFDDIIYEIRKDDIFIKLIVEGEKIIFRSSTEDTTFVKAVVYEAFLKLDNTIKKLKALSRPSDLRKELVFDSTQKKYKIDLSKIIDPDSIIMDLEAENKEAAIAELVDLLHKNGKIKDKEQVLQEIMAREKAMSTGMKYGLAIPHARTSEADFTTIAIGLSSEGIEFDSLDGKPAHVIACLISSNKDNKPHIQVLAAFSTYFTSEQSVEKILESTTAHEVWSTFLTQDQKELMMYDFVYGKGNPNILQ